MLVVKPIDGLRGRDAPKWFVNVTHMAISQFTDAYPLKYIRQLFTFGTLDEVKAQREKELTQLALERNQRLHHLEQHKREEQGIVLGSEKITKSIGVPYERFENVCSDLWKIGHPVTRNLRGPHRIDFLEDIRQDGFSSWDILSLDVSLKVGWKAIAIVGSPDSVEFVERTLKGWIDHGDRNPTPR